MAVMSARYYILRYIVCLREIASSCPIVLIPLNASHHVSTDGLELSYCQFPGGDLCLFYFIDWSQYL